MCNYLRCRAYYLEQNADFLLWLRECMAECCETTTTWLTQQIICPLYPVPYWADLNLIVALQKLIV